MQYDVLSDAELDFEVFQRVYGPIGHDKDMARVYARGRFRPTRNASDAWPIIVENQICLLSLNVKWRAHDFKHMAEHKNPLRAAMIVFLMTQDKS